jgi:glycosyltransferase involved in cell wall biosynthesis
MKSERDSLISVVIPLYNKSASILRAVSSVMSQSYRDWELIVVDDGSSDDGASKVEALQDSRIKVVRQRNGGVSVARNSGIQQASGDYVALLDADDYWSEVHLERLHALSLRFPRAVLLGATYCYVDEAGQSHQAALDPVHVQAPDGLSMIDDFFDEVVRMQHLPFNASSVMFRRETMLKLGGFAQGVTAGEDLLMWARFACEGEVAVSAQPTSFYVVPPVSSAVRIHFVRRPQEPDAVGAGLAKLLDGCVRPDGMRQYLADWHRMRAVLWMELNERMRSIGDLRRGVSFDRLSKKDVICLVALALPASVRTTLLAKYRASKRG